MSVKNRPHSVAFPFGVCITKIPQIPVPMYDFQFLFRKIHIHCATAIHFSFTPINLIFTFIVTSFNSPTVLAGVNLLSNIIIFIISPAIYALQKLFFSRFLRYRPAILMFRIYSNYLRSRYDVYSTILSWENPRRMAG